MTPIRNLLSDAVRYGLAAGTVGVVSLASASAFAQAAPAVPADQAKAKNLDTVEVLGSRIKRRLVDTEATSPVTTLTRADIEQTGLTSTFDIINHISASDGSGLSTVTTQTNGSDGTQTVSLRNLGPQRTLVLVDGKRWVTNAGGIVDLSSIPVAIIERIEVLKDGASAIYGSDAVAGVINIITRKKYEGAQIGWTYGQTTHGDGAQHSEDVTIGANGERSSAVISLSRSEQKAIFAGDRTISNQSVFGCNALLSNFPASDPNSLGSNCGSSSGAFGRIKLKHIGGASVGGTWALNNSFTDSGNATGDPLGAVATASGTSAADFHQFQATDRYNFAPVNYLQQPATRNNLFATGRFDITDNVQAYARVSYTQRQSSQQLAQVPDGLNRTSFGPQWAFVPAANSVFNPFTAAGLEVTQLRFRNVAVGPRHNNFDFNTIGSTVGVQGTFAFADRHFDWDVYAQYNSERDTFIGEHYINLFNLRKALGPSFRDAQGLHCGQPGAIIDGCVPFNIFGGPDLGVSHGVISRAEHDAMVQYVSYSLNNANGNKGYNYGGNISGEIFQLQGGMLGFAAGFESRRATAFSSPDALQASGGSSNNFSLPTKGGTQVDEYYLEINAPLLKDVTFAKELEFDAAVRKSRNSANGLTQNLNALGLIEITPINSSPGNPTDGKFSVRWKPFADLLLRGSYGDTFRAPSVSDLFAGAAENFPIASDPCENKAVPGGGTRYSHLDAAGQASCALNVTNPTTGTGTPVAVPVGGITPSGSQQVHALSGGNTGLKPEHGHDLTFGFVYSPSWATGLNLTADYWRINLKDAISFFGAGTLINGCYQSHVQTDCALIVRDPTSGALNDIHTTQFNAKTLKVDGIDFGLTYKRDTDWGTFGLKWDTTYTKHNQSDGVEFVGGYFGAPQWKYRSVATLDWKRGDWDAAWTMRYTSHLDDGGGCNVNVQNSVPIICNHPTSTSSQSVIAQNGLGFNRIGATTFHDVQVGWRAPWKAHLSIGARNVFGKEPPLVNNSFAQSFDASYDLPGGAFYYFQYRQDF